MRRTKALRLCAAAVQSLCAFASWRFNPHVPAETLRLTTLDAAPAPSNADVEVDGGTVLSFVNFMKTGQEKRQNILNRHGIFAEAGSWTNQQKWLDAFKEVATSVGDLNLFLIGTAIIDNAHFPPISHLEEGLRLLNVAYHMNHRLNGQVLFNPATGEILEGI